ncbi:hypothetical protein M9Y10_032238 [Tritrichomonas musculus]|uniref:Pyridoxamine 5'-phosphate oxidase N-terminal domain-containing protein n=1 Tax=Tritrichomonas musculus TaxID=1915356 RepID=A0ABR2GZG8_9EUKA
MEYKYLSQKDKMPPICPKDKEAAVRKLIIDKLSQGELVYMSTISPDGWPITDCLHFATVPGENDRPIFYLFTHENTRKLENIANNKRVSISVCHTVSFERRNETWAFQFMGLAEEVKDKAEIDRAIKANREKKGYEFTAHLPLEQQPCIRVEPVFGSFTCPQADPKACSIDYLAK